MNNVQYVQLARKLLVQGSQFPHAGGPLRTVPTPSIDFKGTGRSRLGVAYGASRIMLNRDYAAALPYNEYANVVAHEVCHVLTYARLCEQGRTQYDRSGDWAPHGAVWASMMRWLGYTPERVTTPSVAVQGRSRRSYVVVCRCGEKTCGPTVYKRIVQGQKYACQTCRTVVTPGTVKP